MSEHKGNGNHERQELERQERERQQQAAQHGQQREQQERAAQQAAGAGGPAEPGTRLANPAQPNADTEVPPRGEAKAFMREGYEATHPDGYPKLKYHPVHGGIEVKDAGEEAGLYPKTDWFDLPELADLARTHTEAVQVYWKNQNDKLKELEDRGQPVVRNSVQADEAIRIARGEPL